MSDDICMFAVVDQWTRDLRFCRRRSEATIGELSLCHQHAQHLVQIVRDHDDDRESQRAEARFNARAEQQVLGCELKREAERGRVVYYIRRPDGAIKIGSSTNATARMKQLEGTIRPLELLATHAGSMVAEKAMHKRFAAHRLDGEWFAPVAELLAHIAKVNDRHVEASAA